MKTTFSFVDPGAIMGVVVALIILAVGVFAYFTVMNQLQAQNPYPVPSATTTTSQNQSYWAWANNTYVNGTNTGNSVFNIIGIVLIIGAIMSIVGLVYNYVR